MACEMSLVQIPMESKTHLSNHYMHYSATNYIHSTVKMTHLPMLGMVSTNRNVPNCYALNYINHPVS